MTLQNKVGPDGQIVAVKMRGLFMGNRGGRFHDGETQQLHPTRRWASRQWICCKTSFKSRHRKVMGKGYTELFFLDEIAALAAGHRPCFECRRRDAVHFAECWAESHRLDRRPKVTEMDRILHQQRLKGREKRSFEARISELPDGTMVQIGPQFLAVRKGKLYCWQTGGSFDQAIQHQDRVEVLTPPAIVGVLKSGYKPTWFSD